MSKDKESTEKFLSWVKEEESKKEKEKNRHNDPNIEDLSYSNMRMLPLNLKELDCAKVMKELRSCLSPIGQFKSYYIWGQQPTCEIEKFNFDMCWKMKKDSLLGSDSKMTLEMLQIAQKTVKEMELTPDSPPVWKKRTNGPPPLFQKGYSIGPPDYIDDEKQGIK
eukprot:TRINITY_DN4621_c0_g1_i1.p1 TRINITY_DN4621_c0_g1~~TRINITY_DN4621_c0_g1_i1.p1  ORF type:complete len:165 (-),score=61.78 TRINITY_DN4621_c0_g1_i1:127-621(-)